MGREAACTCLWDKTTVSVKAQLETGELILRGGVRKKIPFGDMRKLRVEGEELRFLVGKEPVSLALGSAQAVKWVQAITTPPPTLAKKLGITPASSVLMLGPVDDDAIAAVLKEASLVSSAENLEDETDLILARVDTTEALVAALDTASKLLERHMPIWVIYPKGPGHPLAESSVRSLLLAAGMTDTKVAAVSSLLTALRFIKRKA